MYQKPIDIQFYILPTALGSVAAGVLPYILMRRFLIGILLVTALAVPAVTLAAHNGGIVPCHEGSDCGWSELLQLGQNILNYVITIAITVSAVMFAYAGFLFFSDTGNASNIEKGKKIFGAVAVGLVIVLVAWLVVNTLLDVLTGKGLKERAGSVSSESVDIPTPIV